MKTESPALIATSPLSGQKKFVESIGLDMLYLQRAWCFFIIIFFYLRPNTWCIVNVRRNNVVLKGFTAL